MSTGTSETELSKNVDIGEDLLSFIRGNLKFMEEKRSDFGKAEQQNKESFRKIDN